MEEIYDLSKPFRGSVQGMFCVCCFLLIHFFLKKKKTKKNLTLCTHKQHVAGPDA